ncbi:hypothetical protein RJ639_019844 [Escallonia herrerae]|uniref:Cobalt ion binding protein n=1 Tax=Escallonia herrerae TaxID=1293975 RepID=A0AA89AII1_9ASTE|nr:hypothetical protein RJ639_019844 [Escallonia herrerae]
MAGSFVIRSLIPATECRWSPVVTSTSQSQSQSRLWYPSFIYSRNNVDNNKRWSLVGGLNKKKKKEEVVSAAAAVPNSSNYVVPLDNSPSSSCITRPLVEILRDLNKRISDNIMNPDGHPTYIPWYHANRMLSFYAPGWCGEIRDVIFSDSGSVTVVYRVTIRGSDGEAHRESTGTVPSGDGHNVDPVAAAEEIAFCRACARFGLGLYLYHEE